ARAEISGEGGGAAAGLGWPAGLRAFEKIRAAAGGLRGALPVPRGGDGGAGQGGPALASLLHDAQPGRPVGGGGERPGPGGAHADRRAAASGAARQDRETAGAADGIAGL